MSPETPDVATILYADEVELDVDYVAYLATQKRVEVLGVIARLAALAHRLAAAGGATIRLDGNRLVLEPKEKS